MGFGAPMSQWLRGNFGGQAESLLLNSGCWRNSGFNRDFIAALCANHRQAQEWTMRS